MSDFIPQFAQLKMAQIIYTQDSSLFEQIIKIESPGLLVYNSYALLLQLVQHLQAFGRCHASPG